MPLAICVPPSPLVKAGAPTSGVKQVETVTIVAAAGITQSGTMTCTFTVTGASWTGKTVDVNVILADTAAQVAAKAVTQLSADADVGGFWTITQGTGGNEADVIFTCKQSAANDAGMNIAYTNGTCTGLTPDATSADTTAGVKGDYRGVEAGQYCTDTTNYQIYRNDGTTLCPTWTAI